MGLEEFIDEDEDNAVKSFKKYNLKEKDEKLREIVDNFKKELPDNFDIEFIEASPAIENKKCWIYQREVNSKSIYFIRVSEEVFEMNREYIEKRVKSAMIRLYAYQSDISINGSENTDKKRQERVLMWISGRLNVESDFMIGPSMWDYTCEKLR